MTPPTGQLYTQNSYTSFSLTAYQELHYLHRILDGFPGIWATSVGRGDQSSHPHHVSGIASPTKILGEL